MKPGDFDRLASALETLMKRDAQRDDETRFIQRQLMDMRVGQQVRENAAQVFRFDTSTTNREEVFDVVRQFGGNPGNSLTILAVGGGTLQILLPSLDTWLDVSVGDRFENETISQFRLRATTGASGTARVRVGAYVGR